MHLRLGWLDKKYEKNPTKMKVLFRWQELIRKIFTSLLHNDIVPNLRIFLSSVCSSAVVMSGTFNSKFYASEYQGSIKTTGVEK